MCFLASVNARRGEMLTAARSTAGTNAATLHPLRIFLSSQLKGRDWGGQSSGQLSVRKGGIYFRSPAIGVKSALIRVAKALGAGRKKNPEGQKKTPYAF